MKPLLTAICCLTLSPALASGAQKFGTGSSIVRSGKQIVEYSADLQEMMVYVMFLPSDGTAKLTDFRPDKGDFPETKLTYRGLKIDGPCRCHPVLVIEGDTIKRENMRPMKRTEFQDILHKSKDLKEFLAALK
jgi:hypothetical protein